jgi:hypothetical protein
MRMGMPNLGDEREQHAKEDDADVGFGQAFTAGVGVHVTGYYRVVLL